MAADTRWWRYLEAQRVRHQIPGPTAWAQHLDIQRTQLTTWQSGTRPGTETIKHLARKLDVPVEVLLIEAEHFAAEDFGLEHLPADPRDLDDDELVDELRRRLRQQQASTDSPGADDPAAPASQRGGPFGGPRSRGRRPVSDSEATPANDRD